MGNVFRLRFFLALAPLISIVPLHASSEAPVHAQGSIRIGVIQSLTGIAAEDGKTTVQALRLAAEELRAAGSADIELIVEDDQSESRNTVTAFHKLRNDDVKVIIGATWGFTTNSIVELASQSGIVLFNTSTIPECINLAAGKGVAFSNVMRTVEQVKNFKEYLKTNAIEDLVVVSVNNTWGEAQRKLFLDAAHSENVKVVDEISSSSFDSNDWSITIPRIRAKRAQLLLLLLNKNDLGVFIRKAREQGLSSKIFASYHLYDAFNLSATPKLFNDICFPYPLQRLKSEAQFVTKYQAKYGEEPRIFADNSYDALRIIAEAVQVAERTKSDLGAAVKQTQVEGLVGTYRYTDEQSFGVGTSSLVCVRDGKLVP